MSQEFGIGKEVRDGIAITLVLIIICVVIGNRIAVATAHGEHPAEATQEAPAEGGAAPAADDAKK